MKIRIGNPEDLYFSSIQNNIQTEITMHESPFNIDDVMIDVNTGAIWYSETYEFPIKNNTLLTADSEIPADSKFTEYFEKLASIPLDKLATADVKVTKP